MKQKYLVFIVLLALTIYKVTSEEEVVPLNEDKDDSMLTVTTDLGKVKGSKQLSSKGKTYYSFHGIPFAKPPIGELRFKVSL